MSFPRPAAQPFDSSRQAAFVLATEVRRDEPAWAEVEAYAQAVAAVCAPILGFEPAVRPATLDESLGRCLSQAAGEHIPESFLLPAPLELNLLQRESIGQWLGEVRRDHPEVTIHHDDLDPGDPLLVDCLAGQAAKALEQAGVAPQRAGLVLAATGQGDAETRAQSYRLMRLVWERLGLVRGEIGFLRHGRPFLASTLERCAEEPLTWIVVPQMQWKSQYFEYAEVILQNFRKGHPAAAAWRLADPPGNHPAMTAWLMRRVARLWTEKRQRERVRLASPKRTPGRSRDQHTVGNGIIASITCQSELARLLEGLFEGKSFERVLVKVTWHGYATGTYTDPAALDLLLGALPAKAIILEGHTSSRNLGGATFNWETEARENRAWIRQQEAEYLRRTGLAEVLARRRAQYVNVTECFWDNACAGSQQVTGILQRRGVKLQFPQLAEYVPQILIENAGCPMISFAKFKGPTRLTISNLFGLLPEPLRAAWHGPNITYMARVCCELANLYGALFPLYGMAEGLFSAVCWTPQGLYRSRWGNYDLVENAGCVAASRGLVSADILASRLQGQAVNRSAFFDVIRTELGWDELAADAALPAEIHSLFA
jgi:hypothetical protein